MYGQTGSGKTFTMVGSREQYVPTHIQHSRSNEFNTPRTQSNNEIIYFGKSTKNLNSYHTLNTQESDKSFDNPLRTAGKVSFYRSKSPVPIRDKTPRRTNDKSPIRITRDKSPIRADTQINPKSEFEFQQNKSSDNYNNTFGNFLNSHKRSSTLQYPQNQSIQSTSPQKPYDSSRACEMDNLKNHPGNTDGILMLAMKDIFNEIEKVFIVIF